MLAELRFALRQLTKDVGFTTIAVLTLALGIGANTACFSILYGVVLKDPPFPESSRLVEILNRWGDDPTSEGRLSVAEFLDYSERQRCLTGGIAALISGRVTLASEQGAERIQWTRTTANLFALLGVKPQRGRDFAAADEQVGAESVVVVSHEFWQSHLGGHTEVLGQRIRLGGVEHTIIGVMPVGFSFPASGTSIWKPLTPGPREKADRRDRSLRAFGRLAAGVSRRQADLDFQAVMRQLTSEFPEAYSRDARRSVQVEGLREAQFGHLKAPLGLLATAASVVLAIACVNVSIMFLLRATARQREFRIRLALGASRRHVVRQLLMESGLICLLGTLAGLAVAWISLAVFQAFGSSQIPRLHEVEIDGVVLAFSTAVLMIVTLLVGLAPARSALKLRGQESELRSNRTTEGPATGRLRDGLTVVEVALAVVLLMGAGLTLRSFATLLRLDLGFTPGTLYAFKTNLTPSNYPDAPSVNRFYEALFHRISTLPGVDSVGAVSYLPLSGEAQYGAATLPRATDESRVDSTPFQVGWRVVRGPYFQSMKITLLGGRYFDGRDHASSPPVAIVDEALADRLWSSRSAALGKILHLDNGTTSGPHEVVGVVRAVKHFGPGKESLPEVYVPQSQTYQRGMYTVVQSHMSPQELAAQIKVRLAEVDSSVPMYFEGTVEARREEALSLSRLLAGLIAAFAMLAVALAGVGVFGVTAYSVEQRAREFGIRVSLGAQRVEISKLVLGQVGIVALLGIGLGLAAAVPSSRLLASFLFGITALDVTNLFAVSVIIGLIVLGSSLVPLRRALRVDPARCLRVD